MEDTQKAILSWLKRLNLHIGVSPKPHPHHLRTESRDFYEGGTKPHMKATPNTTPNVTQLGYNASVAIVVRGKIHTITYSSLTPTKVSSSVLTLQMNKLGHPRSGNASSENCTITVKSVSHLHRLVIQARILPCSANQDILCSNLGEAPHHKRKDEHRYRDCGSCPESSHRHPKEYEHWNQ